MTTATADRVAAAAGVTGAGAPVGVVRSAGVWRQALSNGRVLAGGGVLLATVLMCVATLPWTVGVVGGGGKPGEGTARYIKQDGDLARGGPSGAFWGWFGYDTLGRSLLARCLVGGAISLAVGVAAATIAVVLGVSVGVLAGYRGGWVDALLMRTVDVLYGLPYVLLVVLFKVAFEPQLQLGVTGRVVWELVVLGVAAVGFSLALARGRGWPRVVVAGVFALVAVDAVWQLSGWRATSFEVTAQTVEGVRAALMRRELWGWGVLVAAVAGAVVAARRYGDARWLLAGLLGVCVVTAVLNVSVWRGRVWTQPVGAGATQDAAGLVGLPTAAPKGPAVWVGPMDAQRASVVVLFLAIGLVSWLTMARVVRGQVLSLRGQPFIEACRAIGLKETRIFARHILPNLVGPITVYATLTVPSAILQESFLSFLGVGINAPLPSWGNLASEAVEHLYPRFYWWLLAFPCTLLAVTLLSLNFMGDGLRDVFDPKKEAAKI